MTPVLQVHGFLDPGKAPPPRPARRPSRRAALHWWLPGALLAAGALSPISRHLPAAPPDAIPLPGPRRYPAAYRHRQAQNKPDSKGQSSSF